MRGDQCVYTLNLWNPNWYLTDWWGAWVNESDSQRTFSSISSNNWPLTSYRVLCEVRWLLSDQVLQQSKSWNIKDAVVGRCKIHSGNVSWGAASETEWGVYLVCTIMVTSLALSFFQPTPSTFPDHPFSSLLGDIPNHKISWIPHLQIGSTTLAQPLPPMVYDRFLQLVMKLWRGGGWFQPRLSLLRYRVAEATLRRGSVSSSKFGWRRRMWRGSADCLWC